MSRRNSNCMVWNPGRLTGEGLLNRGSRFWERPRRPEVLCYQGPETSLSLRSW